jgi:hypothetical protein
MSERTINDWIAILEPLGYWQAAPEILKNLHAYPADASERNREADSKQVGNALVAWAIICAKEIQDDLGPEPAEMAATSFSFINDPQIAIIEQAP